MTTQIAANRHRHHGEIDRVTGSIMHATLWLTGLSGCTVPTETTSQADICLHADK